MTDMLLAAWIGGLARVGWPTLAILGVLTLLRRTHVEGNRAARAWQRGLIPDAKR